MDYSLYTICNHFTEGSFTRHGNAAVAIDGNGAVKMGCIVPCGLMGLIPIGQRHHWVPSTAPAPCRAMWCKRTLKLIKVACQYSCIVIFLTSIITGLQKFILHDVPGDKCISKVLFTFAKFHAAFLQL